MLHLVCQQIWKTQQWPQDWKRSVFIPVPKKGNAKECSNCCTIALISNVSKVMLKILQASVQLILEKGEEPEIKLPTSTGSLKITRKLQKKKKIYFCFIDYVKAFDCVDHKKLWKILEEMGIPSCLTCLLRNLYAG